MTTAVLYPHKTAGSLMSGIDEIPVVQLGSSLRDVEKMLEEYAKKFVAIDYIYVVDSQRRLKGIFSIKECFSHKKESKVEDIMQQQIIAAKPHTHQERVAIQALMHKIKQMPVVEESGVLLGVIQYDVIIRVLDREAVENALRAGGISGKDAYDNLTNMTIFKSLKHRLPWLIIGLLGGLLTAKIVTGFEETLQKNLILAAFIPLVVYMADAARTQMEAFIIRDLAMDPKLAFMKYIVRQLPIIVITGLVISVLLALSGILFYGNIEMGMVLGVALFLAVISSILTGLIIPFLFSKLKFDPANASGPIGTIVQDVMSVTIYFAIATAVL